MNRYLFVWEESYRLHQELKRWSENFLEKYGPDTVMSLSLRHSEIEEIMQALTSGWLFAEKKLVIVHDMPGTTTSPAGTAELEEQIMNHRDHLNPDDFMIFVSSKPDKRKKSYKFFKKHCEFKEFKPMDMRSLPKFITEEFDKYNKTPNKLSRPLIDLIVEIVGNDGRRLSTEIKKLSQYLNATSTTLDKEVITTIITPSSESTAFDILEELIKNPGKDVLNKIDTMDRTWASWQAAQGGILRWLKSLNAFLHATDRRQDTSSLGLPPFTIARYNKRLDMLLSKKLAFQHLYYWLIDYEYGIKTWQADPDGYRLHFKSLLETNDFLL